VSTPDLPAPDTEDLRGLARGLRRLFEIGATVLAEDTGPSELALRITGHLGCELATVVSVAEKFPIWEHVNVQWGVDAYLAAQASDPACRERLLRLYARDLTLDADMDPVVAGTEGVTASFVKEMIRRTVLASLRAGERPPVLRDAHFAEVLAEMNSERHALTRSLLGVGPGADASAGQEPGSRPAHIRPRRFRPAHIRPRRFR
jgi:hypothetical protein